MAPETCPSYTSWGPALWGSSASGGKGGGNTGPKSQMGGAQTSARLGLRSLGVGRNMDISKSRLRGVKLCRPDYVSSESELCLGIRPKFWVTRPPDSGCVSTTPFLRVHRGPPPCTRCRRSLLGWSMDLLALARWSTTSRTSRRHKTTHSRSGGAQRQALSIRWLLLRRAAHASIDRRFSQTQ